MTNEYGINFCQLATGSKVFAHILTTAEIQTELFSRFTDSELLNSADSKVCYCAMTTYYSLLFEKTYETRHKSVKSHVFWS